MRARVGFGVSSTWIVIFAIGLFGAAAACSDDEAPPAPGDGGVGSEGGTTTPPDDGRARPADYANALCGFYEKCDPLFLERTWGDIATCRTSLALRTADSLGAPGNVVTKEQLAACTSRLGTESCGDDLFTLPECDFRGTREDGASCLFPGQCKGGSCAFGTVDGGDPLCGACATRIAEGGDCGPADCATGSLCAYETNKCVRMAGVGGACDSRTPCQVHLRCGPDGKCAEALASGASCNPDVGDCSFSAGLVCSGPQGSATCKAARFANPGEACGYDAAAQIWTYCRRGFCDAEPTGTCVALTPAGGSCGDGGACESGLDCIEGTCRRKTAASCQ